MSILPKSETIHIRGVWNENLEEEFALIREIVDEFPYIAMDTEFPGVVLRPIGNFKSSFEYNFQTLKANVDLLKLIQLGLTFSDDKGNLPDCGTDKYCVWQFNFREFNLNEDVYANDSIELLCHSGIDFKKNNESGINARRFSELLMSSGVVLNDNVHWLTFHSGYDFGYLLKLLTCQNLPDSQAGFFNLIKIYFPILYDIKHLMRYCNSLHGGLNKLAELLDVERIGICHQADLLVQFLFCILPQLSRRGRGRGCRRGHRLGQGCRCRCRNTRPCTRVQRHFAVYLFLLEITSCQVHIPQIESLVVIFSLFISFLSIHSSIDF